MVSWKQKAFVCFLIIGVLGGMGLSIASLQPSPKKLVTKTYRVKTAEVVAIQTPGLAPETQLNGEHILEANLGDLPLDQYDMFWSIDGGATWQKMEDNAERHTKVISVAVQTWPPQPNSRYELTFRAVSKTGKEISQTSRIIQVMPPAAAAATTPKQTTLGANAPAPTPKIPDPPAVTSHAKPFASLLLYAQPGSPASKQAEAWRTSRPADAAILDKLGAQPAAKWISTSTNDQQTVVSNYVTAAGDKIPMIVLYAIPAVHVSNPSSGKPNKDAYIAWVTSISAGIANRRAMVIVEPDALPLAGQLSAEKRQERFEIIKETVTILRQSNVLVYIDAGHSGWMSASGIAERLRAAGIDRADGFSLNISNFATTDSNLSYGKAISDLVGGKHYIIDTSRNGLGPAPNNEWCNPAGRAVGPLPTLNTSHALVDAYAWIKIPGESDGTCNGGPNAGQFWPEYALGLGQRAGL